MNKVTFAFWGPPNSGKSWLVEAFAQSMKHLNSRFSDVQSGLEIIITDNTGRKIRPQLPLPEASQGYEPNHYIIKRKLLNISSKKFLAEINAHQHEIILIDNTGKNLLVTANLSRTQEEQNYFDMAQSILQDAACIMLALDIGNITPVQYVQDLENLLDILGKTPRHIAACITKADIDEIGFLDHHEAALTKRFGTENAKKIYSLLAKDFRYNGHNVEFFAISSVGYILNKNGQHKPNVTIGEKNAVHLEDVLLWQPVNAEKPFFWLLNHIEQQQIRVLEQKKPRLFRRWRDHIAKKGYWTYKQIMMEMPAQLMYSNGHTAYSTNINGNIQQANRLIRAIDTPLYESMKQFFSIRDIREVCFRLDIDFEEFRYESKGDFIIDLILYCRHRGEMDKLNTIIRKLRPNMPI